jgi:DNA ligase-1
MTDPSFIEPHSIEPSIPGAPATYPSGFSAFSGLVAILGTRTKTNDKLDALTDYFAAAGDKDKVWVIALFSGRRPKRAVNTTQLQAWCTELTGFPAWLFEESYHTVGDLAETIALLLPEAAYTTTSSTNTKTSSTPLTLSYYLEQLSALAKQDDTVKKTFVVGHWMQMNQEERFVFNKLITGGFRIGVSQKTIVNALSKVSGLSASIIAHRISGNWDPSTIGYDELLSEEAAAVDISRPYPFYLAYALEEEPTALGDPQLWQAEWKWDGIRGQIVKRKDQLFVWSRGEELMTEQCWTVRL